MADLHKFYCISTCTSRQDEVVCGNVSGLVVFADTLYMYMNIHVQFLKLNSVYHSAI